MKYESHNRRGFGEDLLLFHARENARDSPNKKP
jgi:hypothetical protein